MGLRAVEDRARYGGGGVGMQSCGGWWLGCHLVSFLRWGLFGEP